jgi:hypothetical protein
MAHPVKYWSNLSVENFFRDYAVVRIPARGKNSLPRNFV